MKTVKIKSITSPQKSKVYSNLNKYAVFVNWGLRCLFTNRKDAELYQNALNYWINDIIYQVNEYLISATVHYRRLWLFYDIDNALELTTRKEISFVENCLKNCYKYTSPGSGFTEVMKYLDNATTGLLNTFHYLEKKQRSRNNWEAIKLIQFEREHLLLLKKEVEEWPQKKYQEISSKDVEINNKLSDYK